MGEETRCLGEETRCWGEGTSCLGRLREEASSVVAGVGRKVCILRSVEKMQREAGKTAREYGGLISRIFLRLISRILCYFFRGFFGVAFQNFCLNHLTINYYLFTYMHLQQIVVNTTWKTLFVCYILY